MSLGEKLLNFRKEKHLSQEEVAELLNVTRQTISKWETDQSLPDCDKIGPICKLYGISADELLSLDKKNKIIDINNEFVKKRALGIGIGIFIYFLSIIWIILATTLLEIDPIVAVSIFLAIIGIGTVLIVYTCIVYKNKKQEEKKNGLRKQIDSVMAIVVLIIYLSISFYTHAWHITWIIWIVYGLISEIIKLIFVLKGETDEEE